MNIILTIGWHLLNQTDASVKHTRTNYIILLMVSDGRRRIFWCYKNLKLSIQLDLVTNILFHLKNNVFSVLKGLGLKLGGTFSAINLKFYGESFGAIKF